MSSLFLDGPAKDQSLELRRTPRFLRVTRAPDLKLDALDQLEDEPRAYETLMAYEIAGKPMRGFIDGAKYRGPFVVASYRLVEPQPEDAEMRTIERWHAWCLRKRDENKSCTPENKSST